MKLGEYSQSGGIRLAEVENDKTSRKLLRVVFDRLVELKKVANYLGLEVVTSVHPPLIVNRLRDSHVIAYILDAEALVFCDSREQRQAYIDEMLKEINAGFSYQAHRLTIKQTEFYEYRACESLSQDIDLEDTHYLLDDSVLLPGEVQRVLHFRESVYFLLSSNGDVDVYTQSCIEEASHPMRELIDQLDEWGCIDKGELCKSGAKA